MGPEGQAAGNLEMTQKEHRTNSETDSCCHGRRADLNGQLLKGKT